jgi:hypothetical protein
MHARRQAGWLLGRPVQHTKGAAFDAKVILPTGFDQDTMAALHGLHRPYKDPTLPGYDPVHFELIP